MNRKPLVPIFMLFLGVLSISAYAPIAAAQSSYQRVTTTTTSASPIIDRFYVNAPGSLVPGSQISFVLQGTPRANASVRISNKERRIPLHEVSPGVYQGTYTVKRNDRITSATKASARLKIGERTTTAMLEGTLGSTAVAGIPAVVTSPGVLAIEQFRVTPIDSLDPGADITFSMQGTPGGIASFTIAGVPGTIPMREVRSGVYEGSYTIRRYDRIAPNAAVAGTLQVAGKTLRTNLNQSLVAQVQSPAIGNLTPTSNITITPGELTSVSGTFDSSAGIDPRTVAISVGGKDVTRSTVITPQFFNYRADLPPGSYIATVTAKDRAGNPLRQSWKFNVATDVAMAEMVVPLSITSHLNNAAIGTGITEVRGRTAPNATVDVQVNSVSSMWGFFGVSQKVLSQTVYADSNGDFVFTFQPRSMSKDARYDVALTSTKNGISKTQNLTLVQQ